MDSRYLSDKFKGHHCSCVIARSASFWLNIR